MANVLTLKWGTLKAWSFEKTNDEAMRLLKKYHEDPVQFSVMMQKDTPKQKQALIDLIDVSDKIVLDWDNKVVSREEAKKYIRNYGINRDDKLDGDDADA